MCIVDVMSCMDCHSPIALGSKREVNLILLGKHLCPAPSAYFPLVRRLMWIARVFVGEDHRLDRLLVKILPVLELYQQLLPGDIDCGSHSL